MTTQDDLLRHPFFVTLMKNVQPIILESINDAPSDRKELAEWKKTSRSKMTPAQLYLLDVFHRATNLNHLFDRLKIARSLLALSPASYRFRKLSITRNDWSDYHFYVYTTSLTSILDCTLLLTAEVFRLGLPPRLCTFDMVTQHYWTARTNIPKGLRALRKALEEHTSRRHRYLHRGEESSFAELTNPDDVLHLRSITFLADQGALEVPRPILSRLWKLQLKKLDPRIDGFEADVSHKLFAVLQSLLPIFDSHLKAYSGSSKG